MATITKGRSSAAFALAEKVFIVLLRDEPRWAELRTLVRTVAIRLVLGTTAGAPIDFLAGLEFDGGGACSSDLGFVHSGSC